MLFLVLLTTITKIMKKITYFQLLFILFIYLPIKAQLPYTESVYDYTLLSDLEYGLTTDYAGNEVSLLMDVYKPLGDENCTRPVMVLVHGGAWVVESKENESMQFIAQELAKRGWVVSVINYRLGTNKATDYTPSMVCSNFVEECAYISDSAEVERANYRSMQDAKGAIRFMKNRSLIDSTDVNNVFIAGESAGAFTALAVGFMSDESKKPASCFEIEDAPQPDSDFSSLTCFDTNNDLSRPDLGGVEGTLNIGEYDASVKGVASFFGGVFDLDVLKNVQNNPSLYLFHQGSDLVVDFDYGPLFQRLSNECFSLLGCPVYEDYPNAYGGEGIHKFLVEEGIDTDTYLAEILDNSSPNNDCAANGHAIDDPALRIQNMAEFFANKIVLSGNDPAQNCGPLQLKKDQLAYVKIINPIEDEIKLIIPTHVGDITYRILSITGQQIAEGEITKQDIRIPANQLKKGVYVIMLQSETAQQSFKLIKK